MTLTEELRDIFTVDDKYYLAHCISSDCQMGKGIAIKFEEKFRLKNQLLKLNSIERIHPTCIRIDRVFNLITKEKYYGKPTYDTIRYAIKRMVNIAVRNEIKYIAMPKIGCGLDKLNWPKVKSIIEEEFKSTDINILICKVRDRQ